MSYTITHTHKKRKNPIKVKVEIKQIGDTIMIPSFRGGILMTDPNKPYKDKATGDQMLAPTMVPYTFKHSRKHQNRSKY